MRCHSSEPSQNLVYCVSGLVLTAIARCCIRVSPEHQYSAPLGSSQRCVCSHHWRVLLSGTQDRNCRGSALLTVGTRLIEQQKLFASLRLDPTIRAGATRTTMIVRRACRRCTQLRPAVRRLSSSAASVDPAEVSRFGSIKQAWWDPASTAGSGPLHAMNSLRSKFIAQAAGSGGLATPLKGLRVLDVGCGGEDRRLFGSTSVSFQT